MMKTIEILLLEIPMSQANDLITSPQSRILSTLPIDMRTRVAAYLQDQGNTAFAAGRHPQALVRRRCDNAFMHSYHRTTVAVRPVA